PPAMVRQRYVAVRAVIHMTALATLHERRVSAPVQQQNGLLLPVDPLPYRLDEGSSQNAVGRVHRGTLFTGGAPGFPQIDDADRGERLPTHSAGQLEQAILSRDGVRPALQRGSSGAEQAHGPFSPGPYHGHLPRMVARRIGLLVGALVLLIDHDRPEVRQRGEDRRSGAD